MATATQKITLSSSRDIPFNKLVLSQSNVRRVKAGISVEKLAESIARRGLIQSLHVRPELDAKGQETGLFEVPAGGRRDGGGGAATGRWNCWSSRSASTRPHRCPASSRTPETIS